MISKNVACLRGSCFGSSSRTCATYWKVGNPVPSRSVYPVSNQPTSLARSGRQTDYLNVSHEPTNYWTEFHWLLMVRRVKGWANSSLAKRYVFRCGKGAWASIEQIDTCVEATKREEGNCQQIADSVGERWYQLAQLIAIENGKPLWEAKTEVTISNANVSNSIETIIQRQRQANGWIKLGKRLLFSMEPWILFKTREKLVLCGKSWSHSRVGIIACRQLLAFNNRLSRVVVPISDSV